VLLRGVVNLSQDELDVISSALNTLRKRRLNRDLSLPAPASA
jgi:hypothetical protein